MSRSEALKQGRESYEKQAWTESYSFLLKADQDESLEPEDLEKLATAAYLIGKDTESEDLLSRAHHDFLTQGKIEQACRCAFWLGFRLMFKREIARGSGWIKRAGRFLEEDQIDCVISGYLLLPVALRKLAEGNNSNALDLFTNALKKAKQYDDADLKTLGRLGRGHALIRLGEIRKGVGLLDEAMAGVDAGEVTPVVSGIVYCAVIEACQEIYDLRRAKEWTTALSRWCESHPDMVPFRGQCLVRRAEIMQLHGSWNDAMAEVEKACDLLTLPPGEPAAGEAFYRKGELHRIQGEYSLAEDAYQEANKWGRQPQPGLARLKLTQGEQEAAKIMIRNLYDEKKDRARRARILTAFVDIMLATDEISLAQVASRELTEIADEIGTPYLQAIATEVHGSVLLSAGKTKEALKVLREAWSGWEKLEAPYFSANIRVRIATACRELGDIDTANMEFSAARWMYEKLGAHHDLARLDTLIQNDSNNVNKHGLTPRQLEVLRLIAAGESNKKIADLLFISERTVERHVSDIFAKLNVPSRSSATAFAYKHDLI